MLAAIQVSGYYRVQSNFHPQKGFEGIMPNFGISKDKMRHRRRLWWIGLLVAVGFGALAPPVNAGLEVFDRITEVRQSVFLKIRISGIIFPLGGRRIQLQIGEQQTHTLLSGADGFAYHRFTPREPGLLRITASADSEQARGLLLVLARGQSALLVEIEPALRTSPLDNTARKGSVEAIGQLQSHYGIVYLTRWPWTARTRQWLDEAGFPRSAVIRRTAARQLGDQGIRIAAVVGSSQLSEEFADAVPQRYSFDPRDPDTPARRWQDILEALRPAGK